MFSGSILILIGLFTTNIIFGLYYGLGRRHYWFNELLHFLGGFFVAMFLYNFTQSWQEIILGLAAISFIWELTELLLAKIPYLSRLYRREFHARPEFKAGDTLLDLLLNFAGATIYLKFLT